MDGGLLTALLSGDVQYGNSFSPDIQIVNTCVHNLSWSHIRRILSVSDPNVRLWYLEFFRRNSTES